MTRVPRTRYLVLVTGRGQEGRVFGPWLDEDKAKAFRDRVNERVVAIEDRRGLSTVHASYRYGRATMRVLDDGKRLDDAVMVATDGLKR